MVGFNILRTHKTISTILFIVAGTLMVAMLIIGLISGEFDKLINNLGEETLDPDDICIDAVTDEDIIELKYGAKLYLSGTRKSGERSGVQGPHQNIDRTMVSMYAKEADGMVTLMATRVENETLKLNISNELELGEMLVVVIKDDQIVDRFEGGGAAHYEYKVDGESIFLVRYVCKDARFEISSEREIVEK